MRMSDWSSDVCSSDRCYTDVRGHCHDSAGACADAVDRGDHGLRTGAHRLHQIARHSGEGEKLGHVHLGERADDLVDVAARAELAACTSDNDRLNILLIDQIAE